MWVLGAWRPLGKDDFMETVAATAGQPVSSGIFIEEGGVRWSAGQEQGATGLGLAPGSPQMPGVWAAQPDCDHLL